MSSKDNSPFSRIIGIYDQTTAIKVATALARELEGSDEIWILPRVQSDGIRFMVDFQVIRCNNTYNLSSDAALFVSGSEKGKSRAEMDLALGYMVRHHKKSFA